MLNLLLYNPVWVLDGDCLRVKRNAHSLARLWRPLATNTNLGDLLLAAVALLIVLVPIDREALQALVGPRTPSDARTGQRPNRWRRMPAGRLLLSSLALGRLVPSWVMGAAPDPRLAGVLGWAPDAGRARPSERTRSTFRYYLSAKEREL